MNTVNVSMLKNNPSEALRFAREQPVLVMNRDKPEAAIFGLRDGVLLSSQGAKIALATALFKNGGLSLVRGAKMAELSVTAFIDHLSRLNIPIISLSEAETEADIETLDQWLAK
jgi:predicted HTH domain antitoxin